MKSIFFVPKRTLRLALAAGVLTLASAAWAQDDGGLSGLDVASERSRIAQARNLLDRAQAAAQAQCYRRFAVNDCLADVRRSYRAQRDELHRQDNALSEQERRARAAQAHSRISEKIEAAQAAQAASQTQPARAGPDAPAAKPQPANSVGLKLDDGQ